MRCNHLECVLVCLFLNTIYTLRNHVFLFSGVGSRSYTDLIRNLSLVSGKLILSCWLSFLSRTSHFVWTLYLARLAIFTLRLSSSVPPTALAIMALFSFFELVLFSWGSDPIPLYLNLPFLLFLVSLTLVLLPLHFLVCLLLYCRLSLLQHF